MRFAFDTGYFIRMATGHLSKEHRSAFASVADGTALGFVSGIVIYEIKKYGYRKAFDGADFLTGSILDTCTLDWPDTPELMDEAARLSHGNGIPMADAMILTAALRRDVDAIYTTDSDLLAYDGPIDIIRI